LKPPQRSERTADLTPSERFAREPIEIRTARQFAGGERERVGESQNRVTPAPHWLGRLFRLAARKVRASGRLYKVGSEYFVLDGHHRIAAARLLGQVDIDANVVELIPSHKCA
jgi:hypothetical protein